MLQFPAKNDKCNSVPFILMMSHLIFQLSTSAGNAQFSMSSRTNIQFPHPASNMFIVYFDAFISYMYVFTRHTVLLLFLAPTGAQGCQSVCLFVWHKVL